MGNFYGEPKPLLCELDVLAGSSINECIEEAIEIAGRMDCKMRMEFNDVIVLVRSDSHADLIYRDWRRASRGYINGHVGPYPKRTLNDEELANDARLEAERKAREEESARKYHEEAEAKKTVLAAKLDGVVFEVSNDEVWQSFKRSNNDPYGAATIEYAEQWARLMQVEIASGKVLEEIADSTSHEADTDGITGFMYGAAVSTLAQCWKYGEQLRRWHNIKTQVGTEGDKANESGGTLNPALLIIGGQS